MKQGVVFDIDGEILKECPAKKVTPVTALYIKWYYQYKKGRMLFPGNAGQQPAKLIEAFEIIEDEMYKIEEKRRGR